jgi:hypothetical protein
MKSFSCLLVLNENVGGMRARRALMLANLRELGLKRDRLRFLADAGYTYYAAARETGISVSAARAQYMKDAILIGGRKIRVITSLDLKKLRALAAAGYTRVEAARELGISRDQARYWDLKENFGFIQKNLGPAPVEMARSLLPKVRHRAVVR